MFILAEDFYSIQGEGPCAGVPAVFLRLAGCNLDCVGFGCDTKTLWQKGEQVSFDQLLNKWQKNSWLDKLKNGAHLVITGGEPLLQQDALIDFMGLLAKPYTEIETNATILIKPTLLSYINQINASPKLTSSGNVGEKAYQPEVLTQLAHLKETKFKFVVTKESDIDEIISQYIVPFTIKQANVWLMPEGKTEMEINKRASMVAELCKKHMLQFSPRLQINIWGGKSGV